MTNCERCDTTAGVDAGVYLAGAALAALAEQDKLYYYRDGEHCRNLAIAVCKIADAVAEELAETPERPARGW